MKLLSQKREGNKVFLEIEESYQIFQDSFEKALIDAGREVKVPGFRPGKAPKQIIEKAISPEYVESRAAQDLISDLYPQIIDEAKIDPVDYPNVEIVTQEKDKPFVFKLSVEVYPEVKLGKYKGIKLEKKSAEVSEEEILTTLGQMQERLAKFDAEGKKELLPLDDEFAKKVSSFGTMAEFKEEVRRALTAEKTSEAEADLKNQAVALATDGAKFDLPAAMVEREIDVMIDELKTSLAQSSLTLEDYLRGTKKEEKAMRQELKKSAELRMRGKVVLLEIAKAEKISVNEQEIEQEVKSMAESSGQEPGDFRKKVSVGMKKYIEEYLTRQKALDFVIRNATIKEGKEAKQ